MAALTTFVPWVGGGPDAMRMCHVDVNRGGLAENGRRGYTGPVRKFNYGDSIPLERAVKTVGRRECTPCGYRPWGFRAARFDSREGFRGTGRMQIFRFPNGRTDHRSPPVFPCGYLSYRNGNASRRWRKVCRKLETKKRLIYAYHRLLAPSSNTPASYTVFNTINRKTRGRYASSIATNTSFLYLLP